MSRIVVTGMGIISAIGNSAAQNRRALIDGSCGIGPLQLFPSRFCKNLPVGEIKISTEQLITKLQAFEPGVTRTTLLALHAFEEAVADSSLSAEVLSAYDTALIGASTVGGICLTDEMYSDTKIDNPPSPFINSYDFGATSLYLQKRYKISGLVNTINTACSSAANAIMLGAKLINSGYARRAIVGGFDSLAKFTINGFNALHILSDENCAPFDDARNGLNLGEGAAFLVLEREQDIKGKKIYAALTGYANANDAYHASSLSDEGTGPFKAMKDALTIANILPSQIDYINAHGTGTQNNDQVESVAMMRLFNRIPAFTSTKANVGHTLGAAGAIEAVYCILNLLEQELYPQINFKNAIAGTGLEPLQHYIKTPLKHIMSNSFGFGGNCSSLIFSNV